MRDLSTNLAKNSRSSAAVLHDLPRHGLHELLGQVHVVGEVSEGHFRLDHPELGRMPRGVGVLGAEGGPEGVDVAQRAGEELRLELPGHGQPGLLAEEVRPERPLAFGRRGRAERERGHPEHLARALAVRAGDDRRVQVVEPALAEEPVHGKGALGPDAEEGAVLVGAGPQVGDRRAGTRPCGASSEGGRTPGRPSRAAAGPRPGLPTSDPPPETRPRRLRPPARRRWSRPSTERRTKGPRPRSPAGSSGRSRRSARGRKTPWSRAGCAPSP